MSVQGSSSPKFHTGVSVDDCKQPTAINNQNRNQNLIDEFDILSVESINDLLTDYVYSLVIKQASLMHDILTSAQNQCQQRDYNAFDAPLISSRNIKLVHAVVYNNSEDKSLHEERLHRNVSSFGLRSDPGLADGDCAFRAIIRQLCKVVRMNETTEEGTILKSVLHQRGINCISEDNDVLFFRQIFVDTIEKDPKYHPFLLNTDVTLSGLSAFRQPGT